MSLTHDQKQNIQEEETNTNKHQCPLSRTKVFVKEMSFKSGVRGRGSDR